VVIALRVCLEELMEIRRISVGSYSVPAKISTSRMQIRSVTKRFLSNKIH